MNYYEIDLIITPLLPGREILLYELGEIGYESFEEKVNGLSAYIQEEQFSENELKNLMHNYQDVFTCEVNFHLVEQQNWNATWESNFEPIPVGEQLLIRAPFHHNSSGFPLEVIIQPQMSFGTGHHETTWLIARRLLEMELKGISLLDMGCGTGVLAILASKLGAHPVTAIDNDEWAVENTKENRLLNNNCDVIVEKGEAPSLVNRHFQVILANINRNVLLADMEVYFNALLPGGKLLLSGFFTTDIEVLRSKAECLGLTFAASYEKHNWAMLEFKK